MEYYGNKTWNNATDNKDKSVVPLREESLQKILPVLEQSGLNYYAYVKDGTAALAVNSSDTDKLKTVLGDQGQALRFQKSARPYTPPQKNIIGNVAYRYIPDKQYISLDRDTALKVAEQLEKANISFSGVIYVSGKATLTVGGADLARAEAVKQSVLDMRRQFTSEKKAEQIIGNTAYREIQNRRVLFTDVTPKQYAEMKDYLDSHCRYSGLIRNGKVMFTVDEADTVLFSQAIDIARDMQETIAEMRKKGFSAEQIESVSGLLERAAEKDDTFLISNNLDPRFTPEQFEELKEVMALALEESEMAIFNKDSAKNKVYALHKEFTHLAELADIYALHPYSDEQKAAIAEIYTDLFPVSLFEVVDETYPPAEMRELADIIQRFTSYNDVQHFLDNHQKRLEIAPENLEIYEALKAHKPVYLHKDNGGDGYEFHNERIEYYEGYGFAVIGDTDKDSDLVHQHFYTRNPEEVVIDFIQSGELAKDGYVIDGLTAPVREEQTAEITPETPELTDKEKAFLNGDLVKFLAKEPVAWDEIEDMGYRLFDKNYYVKYAPHDNSSFGNGLSDHALFDLARRFQNGEDIRAELAKALLGGQTFFRTNKGNEFTATHGEDSLTARFGNAEREISYAEIGGAMLDIIQKEHDDIVHDSTIEALLDDVKGIDKETAEKVLTAFDNSRLHGWDTENNPVKINRIKRAIYEVLGDDEKTEAAFAAIAWCKYDVRFDKPVKEESSIHFGLLGNGITAYDVSRTDPETHDYPIVAHISPEGVITMREEVSAEDMERIRQQAQSARDEFMSSWNKLSTIAKYQRLLDNADITTLSNIHKEKLPTEETIAKYMPFVFFKEGERPEPEQEQNKAGFQIYQLPSGEQYHGIRFESLDTLAKEGVSLNISDYDLVYEGELPDFKGNATLESLFSRFNNDRPADFTGHSLSVSDVIVVTAEDKQTAYYCDSFGFVEMPDFFKEKEIAQEQTRPSVSDLSVGDVIRYEGKRYEVEKLDERGIDLKDLDSPDFGGVLLSTNEVLSFPGWREDMERKGFEILSKADTAVEDERKLVTLQDVVNQFFGTDCESAETENGTWKLAIADGDKVAELFYDGEAVCGIYNHGDKMEIEPYRELSTFPKLLQTAMLEHNPDKPVEIMEYQRTFDTPLDKAKYLINSFCEGEHGQTADFSDLHNVGIVYTTLTDDELPIQITADLVDFKITHEFNGEVFAVDSFDSIEDMIENGLSALDFSELISVPSEVLEGQTAPKQEKDEPVKLKTIVIDLNPQNTTRFERDEPTAEGSLDKAKNLINDFCVSEYSTEADFSNLTHIDLAYTTDEETMLPIQVYADLEQFRIVKEYDGNEAVTQNFGSLDEMLPALESLDFGDLVYLADEEKGITERTDEGIADHAPSDEPAVDDDTPLFADESVMEKIEADSKADDFSFKPFTNDDQGEQLTLFGDSEPLVSEQPKKRNAPKKEQYETGLFVGGVNRFAALHDELMRGTGFEHGKQTVTAFYKEHKPTNKEFADFLKQHYGVGGHSGDGEIGFVDHDSKGIVFTLETGEKFKFTWSDVAQQLSAMIDKGEYLPSESMTVDEPATTEKVVTADNIEIGDKFRYKGKEYTVDTMAGVYSDDIGVSHMETMSNGTSYAVTENVDRHTLIRDGEYLGNPDKRITPIVQPAETVSEPIPTEQPKQTANTDPTRFTALSDEATAFFTDYPPIPIPEMSPWGEVQECTIIAKGVFEVSTAGHGGIMIRENLAEQILSDEALQVGFTEDGFRCYEEDADAQIPLRELLDKGILDKEEYFSDKYHSTFEEKGEWFENAINGSIAAAHPDYWSAHEQAVGNSTTAHEEQAENAENFTITDEALGEGGQKAKFQANITAIKTLKQIEAENRPATAEEKEILSRYVGWGGLAPAFEEQNSRWTSEHQELTELLTAEEYRSARASTLDAFYTSPLVIDGIYEALHNFGFEGGNVLEPSCGIGNFFGRMDEETRKDSHLYGVEIDSLSGRIAQKLYPTAEITINGFEKNEFQNGSFDVVLGNVPFGYLGFKDEKHNTTQLHDYFFAESLDKVKTGGILALVTSAGTLDKQNEATRAMLAQQADLIGAVRLPSTTFKGNANTEVTTDIIFLQKRSEPPAELPDWVHIGQTEDGIPINKYYEQHPDMVLGDVVEGNKLYSKANGTMVVPFEGADLKTLLHEAVGKLSAQISDERPKNVYAKAEQGEIPVPNNLRNYSFFEHEDKVYFKTADRVCAFRFDDTNKLHKRAKAFIELRDTVRELLTAQELDKPDSEIKALQEKLNAVYDSFYKKFGLLHSRTNKKLFSEDISYNLVLSLEKEIDKDKLVAKSDLFTKRTIRPPKPIDHVETAMEALTLSTAEKACVDFDYMSELTGMTENELKKELEGEIFKIPHTVNTYQTKSEYLSGDIRQKLKAAQEAAEYDSDFNINVTALKEAMPTPLKAGDIDVKIGAAWIDPQIYQQFIYELVQTPEEYREGAKWTPFRRSTPIKLTYSPTTGTFHFDNKRLDMSVNATKTFGTRKMNAYEIMEQLLNLKEPKIYKTVEVTDKYGNPTEKRVIDQEATRVVQKKADKIRSEFKKWIFKDGQRREMLVDRYNELFNSVRPREYDGSALSFPMMNSDIHLHEHQKNAIAHALFGGNTLFAHSVGAGKTFEMIATAMEAKRLGLCTKSLFAVPNHLTEQIGSDFRRLYPAANILVATKADFQKANRQQLFAKIATGNFDAIIIGHSQLGMIPISKERQIMQIQEQIDDVLRGIEELKKQDGSKFQIKQMERTRKSLQKQLDKLEKSHDDTITFEQLGVDKLFVDEAHEFKNLFCPTKLANLSGVSNSASQKAFDLFMKCRYLDEKTGGRGVVLATGTPLSNSVTELHTMMRYLEYDFLASRNLQNFDNWITVFGEQKTDWELAPAGNRFKERTRIANYTGIPELMSMFKQVADIRTADTMDLDVPDHEVKIVNVEATELQQQLVQELADRADVVNSGGVDPSVDNMLKITSDGRKLGLDPRLIDPSLEDDPNTKLNQCVANVLRIHKDTEADKLTQIIFCDLGVPHKSSTADKETAVEGEEQEEKSVAEQDSLEEECDFCVYDDIRKKLIAGGIPASEIAYIHDAKTEKQKAALFEKVRTGEIRVLLGSTAKMGTGTNVQKKLIAVHDLDIPWRPADLEQRAGRIIRQGNENPNVEIYRYVTKGTFDAYSYQTLEKKQRFIAQIMTSKDPSTMMRKCEDVDQQAFSYAEVKALCTGDERVKELLMLDNEVKELSALVVDHSNTVYEMEDKVAKFPQAEQRLLTALDHLKTDRQHLRKLPIDPETKMPVFKITIGDTVYTDRKEAAKAFEETALKLCTKPDTPVKIGEFQGFPLSVMINSNWKGGGMTAELRGAYPHTFKLTESFAANLRRMEGTLYKIDSHIDDVNAELSRLRVDFAEAQRILSEPFPQEQELKDKQDRLKTLTVQLNQEALEAKRNAPQQQKTCYFELAKLKKEAMKRRKQGKDKGQEKKPKGDSIED